MLYEFHDALVRVLTDKLPVAVWPSPPDDVAELPCVVVSNPSARQTSTAVVFDLECDVFVLGRRQQAGDNLTELIALADDVWTVLGGTRGTKPEGYEMAVTGVDPRVVTVASIDVAAYIITVESSAATC